MRAVHSHDNHVCLSQDSKTAYQQIRAFFYRLELLADYATFTPQYIISIDAPNIFHKPGTGKACRYFIIAALCASSHLHSGAVSCEQIKTYR